MKKKKVIILIGILVVISISIIIIILQLNKNEHKSHGYGFEYEIPEGYKFSIRGLDLSAVDGPGESFYVFDDQIIHTEYSSEPNFSSMKATVYKDIDTSNIKYKKENEHNGIIERDNTTTQQIRKAIKNKRGKVVCDYVRYFNYS